MPPKLLSSTLVHKIRQPAEPGSVPHPALILLHGQGTNEDALLGLAHSLDPRLFVISARAPFQYAKGADEYTWYSVPAVFTPHPMQFKESLHRLEQFILDAKQHYPVDGRRVFLLGFSMGSVMAIALSLAKPEMVRGIAAYSGYIPENVALHYAWNRLQTLSIFIAHGTNDPIIPVHFARRAQDLISKTDADLTYREYPISHRISKQSLHDLSCWLEKRLIVPMGT